jgi:hypothetical protein
MTHKDTAIDSCSLLWDGGYNSSFERYETVILEYWIFFDSLGDKSGGGLYRALMVTVEFTWRVK